MSNSVCAGLSAAIEENAKLNLVSSGGLFNLGSDLRAIDIFMRDHVLRNSFDYGSVLSRLKLCSTAYSRLSLLVRLGYYSENILCKYSNEFIDSLYDSVRDKFSFTSFAGCYKFYRSYALKDIESGEYLESFEDRVIITALYLGLNVSDEVERRVFVKHLVDEMISGRFQPATPTFLNSGKLNGGGLVSCFLLRVEDNMESIARCIMDSLQLSKRGGGVSINLTNIREDGSPIKGIDGQASGVIPVMKLLEDSFSYANQLGSRQGAGAVYLHANHMDILKFIDTKRENADEKVRIKTLSVGVIIPDIVFHLAKENKRMCLFSAYDIYDRLGVSMSDIDISSCYNDLVSNDSIRRTEISARELFTTIAQVQLESGYPYLMFEDNVNRHHVLSGRVNMSNLCSEILQVNSASKFCESGQYSSSGVGQDISCNLGSLNIAKVMEGGEVGKTVETAVRSLTAVSDLSDLSCSPSVFNGNYRSHAIGLGQMNLHGFLAKEGIMYGSDEALDFVNMYFYMITYYCLVSSNKIARERGIVFCGFEKSKYSSGEYFDKYIDNDWFFRCDIVRRIFNRYRIKLPTSSDWLRLKQLVMRDGLYNAYLQAVPPTGSIAYINHSTPSLLPITSKIEIRKEGKLGRVYYPAPYLSEDTIKYYDDAYKVGYKAIIDTYAEATKHVDQGLSLTLFFNHDVTTDEINRAQIYAWKKGIKTLYYVRVRQEAPDEVKVRECIPCSL